MIQLKIDKALWPHPGDLLQITNIIKENPKLKVVSAELLPYDQAIIVTKGSKDVDWSRIADMIAEGYTSGIDSPEGTNWELNKRGD